MVRYFWSNTDCLGQLAPQVRMCCVRISEIPYVLAGLSSDVPEIRQFSVQKVVADNGLHGKIHESVDIVLDGLAS